jgi:hypothetical protein
MGISTTPRKPYPVVASETAKEDPRGVTGVDGIRFATTYVAAKGQKAWGIASASWAYIACMTVLACWFGGLFALENRE